MNKYVTFSVINSLSRKIFLVINLFEFYYALNSCWNANICWCLQSIDEKLVYGVYFADVKIINRKVKLNK